MREIGGYIELDTFKGSMLHSTGIKLNSGRNALAYLIKAKKIRKILMPKFMCNSCDKILEDNDVVVKYYSIGMDFIPKDIERETDEWIYIVNYYGQLSTDDIKVFGGKIICDNAQAYFNEPLEDIDSLYTCRKFFGVADGAILYTDCWLEDIPQSESFNRMHFLLGRYERTASEFYQEYVDNNDFFVNEPIKRMSKLTENLLHGINYEFVKNQRTENYTYLYEKLFDINRLNLKIPIGAFMYPLYVDNGFEIRKIMQKKKIYIPTLWPNVFNICEEKELEYDMARNILPLPVDQRYNRDDMEYLLMEIMKCIE